jgi:hypothetical protein
MPAVDFYGLSSHYQYLPKLGDALQGSSSRFEAISLSTDYYFNGQPSAAIAIHFGSRFRQDGDYF